MICFLVKGRDKWKIFNHVLFWGIISGINKSELFGVCAQRVPVFLVVRHFRQHPAEMGKLYSPGILVTARSAFSSLHVGTTGLYLPSLGITYRLVPLGRTLLVPNHV